MNVLSFLLATKTMPRRVIVEKGDDYLLFLTARFIEAFHHPSSNVKHVKWTKKEDGRIRSVISTDWNPEVQPVYVVQGAPEGWCESLEPSYEVPCIVSQEKGGLTCDPVDPKNVRSLLIVLKDIHDGKGPWDLPKAASADWQWIESWADVEPSIIRMILLQEDAPVQPHGKDYRINRNALLSLVRESDISSLLALGDRYSFPWLHKALCEESVRMAEIKGYQEKGVAEDRMRYTLPDFSWRDERVMEEAAHWGWADLRKMAEELILFDWSRSSRPRIELARIVLGKKYELTASFF